MDTVTEIQLWLEFACAALSGSAANERADADGLACLASRASILADEMLDRVKQRWPVAADDEPEPDAKPGGAG